MPAPTHFCTTRWTVVLQAGDRDSADRDAALAELLEAYWYPLYGFIRRQGYDEHEAEDLLQGFIARLLEKDSLSHVQEGRGRFRNFLLVCLRNYLAGEVERASAQKRGGGSRPVSIDVQAADARFGHEPAHELTAQRQFERDWAVEVIGQSFARLAADWNSAGKQELFAALSQYLVGTEPAPSYAAAAEKLGMSEGAVRTAVHRLRGQFREALCEQVAATLDRDDLLEDEIRRLFSALRV
jgi:RNA polymerase sigma-70 factor (ECF subfamily)